MDSPFLAGFAVLAVVAGIGFAIERWRDWAKGMAALAFIALALKSLWTWLQ